MTNNNNGGGIRVSSISDIYSLLSVMILLGSGIAWGLKLENRIDVAISDYNLGKQAYNSELNRLREMILDQKATIEDLRRRSNGP